MSRARDIVDKIMGSERFASSHAFNDRVYADEPILRTGADAFGTRSGRRVSVDITPADSTPVDYPFVQPRRTQRTYLPRRYRQMRELARRRTNWSRSYSGGGSSLFYEQGKFMEDFEDDFAGEIDFARYATTYEDLSDYQLRCYFGWRTRLRAGQPGPAPLSFLFLHAFELLCGIGASVGEAGYHALEAYADQYVGTNPTFDAHMGRWMHDYVVFYGLAPALLTKQTGSFPMAAVAVLRRAEKVVLATPSGLWPDVQTADAPSSEELLDALVALSRYRADRSRYFKDHREDVAHVVARVYARMVTHCAKRRKTGFVDGLFGGQTRISYTMFPSALFWSPTRHPDVCYEVSESECFVCESGFWYRQIPCRRTETSKELGALLHAVDARMRVATGDAHPLKSRALPKYQGKFVDDEIQALLELREAQEKARVRIDRSVLGDIRSASVRTREALLTDEEREEEVAAPIASAHVSIPAQEPSLELWPTPAQAAPVPITVQEPSAGQEQSVRLEPSGGQVADEGGVPHADLLRALLDDQPMPQLDSLQLSLAIDEVNEAFLDIVGDVVIEFDGDIPVLVEDYEQDVRDALL